MLINGAQEALQFLSEKFSLNPKPVLKSEPTKREWVENGGYGWCIPEIKETKSTKNESDKFWQVGMGIKPTEDNLKKAKIVLTKFINDHNADFFHAFGPKVRFQLHPGVNFDLDTNNKNPILGGCELCFYVPADSRSFNAEQYKKILIDMWAAFQKENVEMYYPSAQSLYSRNVRGEIVGLEYEPTPYHYKRCVVSCAGTLPQVNETNEDLGAVLFDPLKFRITKKDLSGVKFETKLDPYSAVNDKAKTIFKDLHEIKLKHDKESKGQLDTKEDLGSKNPNYPAFLDKIKNLKKKFDAIKGVDLTSTSFSQDQLKSLQSLISEAEKFNESDLKKYYFAGIDFQSMPKNEQDQGKLKERFLGWKEIIGKMEKVLQQNISNVEYFYSELISYLPDNEKNQAASNLKWGLKNNYFELLLLFNQHHHKFPDRLKKMPEQSEGQVQSHMVYRV